MTQKEEGDIMQKIRDDPFYGLPPKQRLMGMLNSMLRLAWLRLDVSEEREKFRIELEGLIK